MILTCLTGASQLAMQVTCYQHTGTKWLSVLCVLCLICIKGRIRLHYFCCRTISRNSKRSVLTYPHRLYNRKVYALFYCRSELVNILFYNFLFLWKTRCEIWKVASLNPNKQYVQVKFIYKNLYETESCRLCKTSGVKYYLIIPEMYFTLMLHNFYFIC